MATRRGFLAGLMATGVLPTPSWSDVGSPAYLSAAKIPNGSHSLVGINVSGEKVFAIPLPDRGHAAAAHPTRPEAIAFARRPGTYAVGIHCDTGREFTRFSAPADRHFYGHGVFSEDGTSLLTPTNDYRAGVGRISIWDAGAGNKHLKEVSSGGVGPHDIALLPQGRGYVIANGGIETHPDTGRSKLNIPEMQPNLSYLDAEGQIVQKIELTPDLHRNSIRHLALRDDGLVAFAMQWQGDATSIVPLLGLHEANGAVHLLSAPEPVQRQMQGYGASVAFSGNGGLVAVSSSRGGIVTVFDVATRDYLFKVDAPDISGLAPATNGFYATTGQGMTLEIGTEGARLLTELPLAWDNHLVSLV